MADADHDLPDSATEGSYLLDGLDTSALNDRDRSALRGRRIGFVFQAFHPLPYRTALENVLLAELYNQTPRGDRFRAAVDALEAVGLAHRLDAPTTLSGGECQRVAIARALVNRPSLLLCDEPTASQTVNLLAVSPGAVHAMGLTMVAGSPLSTYENDTSQLRAAARQRQRAGAHDRGPAVPHRLRQGAEQAPGAAEDGERPAVPQGSARAAQLSRRLTAVAGDGRAGASRRPPR